MADEITAADDTNCHEITGSNDVTVSNDVTKENKGNKQQDPLSAGPDTDKPSGNTHEVVNIDSDSDDDEELVVIEDKKEKITSDEIAIVKETNSSDKDSCSICLSNFTNRSFINECFHAFCYYCILQWSEVSQTCPLCKKQFGTIIHDVKSITEYKITKVKRDEPALLPFSLRAAYRPTVVYRTTAMGRPREQEGEGVSTSGNSRRKRKKKEGPRHETEEEVIRIKEGRMRVYERNLFAKEAGAESGRRKATPEFYTEFEGAKHRLYPWMRMDLEVLLYGDQRKVLQTLELMWELLDKHHITSPEFKRQVEPILAAKTDHFCHELHMFAISSRSHWKTYLANVKYGESRWDASPVRYIGDHSTAGPGDTISNTKWNAEEEETRAECSSNSSDIQFIGESELDVNITENSCSSSNCESDKESSSKFLIVMKKSDYEGPIDVDDIEDGDDTNTRQKTPVFIDLDDIPPTPTPPQSPVSRDNSPHCSPVRYNSPICGMMQASPLHGLELPHFPCSPIKRNSPVKHNSPVRSRSPSPMKGKGKERKRKRSVTVPVIEDAPSPVRVLMDDSEPCSSKYLT